MKGRILPLAKLICLGVLLSLVKDGELFFAKGYGYADLKNRERVVVDETLFRVGSVGKPFTATAVMQLVEEGKLDMHHTTTRQPLPPELAENLALGYTYANGGYEAERFEFYQTAPAGSMSATATDMAHFMISHLQNGRYGDERILQEDTAEEMHRRHFGHDPRVNGLAYGFAQFDRNDQRIIGWGGDTTLFHSRLVLLPEQDAGLFFSYNSAGGEEARDELFGTFLDRYYPVPDSPAKTSATDFRERAGGFAGSYGSTRASQTTPEKLNALRGTLNVSASGDAALLTRRTLGGQPQRWVEVEPLVFREVDGQGNMRQENMVFRENGQGRVTHLFFGGSTTVAYARLAWYETPALHVGLLAVCAALFLSAIVLWPIGALRDRGKGGAGTPRPGPSCLARWLAGGTGALSLLYLIGYALVLSASDPLELAYGDPPLLRVVEVLPFPIVVLALGALVLVVPVWIRRYWSVAGRVHYTVVALAGLGFVWFLYYWNLLEELWY